jgi:hypothetical protein
MKPRCLYVINDIATNAEYVSLFLNYLTTLRFTYHIASTGKMLNDCLERIQVSSFTV